MLLCSYLWEKKAKAIHSEQGANWSVFLVHILQEIEERRSV